MCACVRVFVCVCVGDGDDKDETCRTLLICCLLQEVDWGNLDGRLVSMGASFVEAFSRKR